MSAHTVSPGTPRILRSYRSPSNQDYECAIWQAARATTTFPLLFKPIMIGLRGLEEPFVDGSLGCNNPLNILLEEAYQIFPDRHVSCVVSLGAGQLGPNSFLSQDLVSFLVRVSSDCEQTAGEAQRRFADVPDVYFRFDVSQGLQNSESEDKEHVTVIDMHTSAYMYTEDISQRLDSVVKALDARRLGPTSIRQLCMPRSSSLL